MSGRWTSRGPRGIVVSTLGILAVPALSLAQEDSVRGAADFSRDRFALYTRCAPVIPNVEMDSEDLEELTREDVMVAVTSRLRAARILIDADNTAEWRRRWRLQQLRSRDEGEEAEWRAGLVGVPGAALDVSVTIVGPAVNIRAELFKRFYDPLSDEAGIAVRWWRSSTGTHGSDPGSVRNAVAGIMDHFIDEYLRVNAGACK